MPPRATPGAHAVLLAEMMATCKSLCAALLRAASAAFDEAAVAAAARRRACSEGRADGEACTWQRGAC